MRVADAEKMQFSTVLNSFSSLTVIKYAHTTFSHGSFHFCDPPGVARLLFLLDGYSNLMLPFCLWPVTFTS